MPERLVSQDASDLTGKFLISMPDMGDPRFDNALILICEHTPKGAMGLIVNKPTDDVKLGDLYENLSLDISDADQRKPVHFGGPVEMGRGFVLHSQDFESGLDSHRVIDGVNLTATVDVLEEIGQGQGPSRRLVLLGYAGWGVGQLEGELANNAWLVCDAEADIVFNVPDPEKWPAALGLLGVDPLMLSSEGGTA